MLEISFLVRVTRSQLIVLEHSKKSVKIFDFPDELKKLDVIYINKRNQNNSSVMFIGCVCISYVTNLLIWKFPIFGGKIVLFKNLRILIKNCPLCWIAFFETVEVLVNLSQNFVQNKLCRNTHYKQLSYPIIILSFRLIWFDLSHIRSDLECS